MTDPSQIVKQILITAGIGQWLPDLPSTNPWKLAMGSFPDKPDRVMLITQTGGLDPYPNLLVDFPSVQLMVRGNQSGYQEANAKIREAKDALLGIAPGTVVGGDTLQSCIQRGDVISLGLDDQNRPMFSANFSLIVLPGVSAGSHRAPIT